MHECNVLGDERYNNFSIEFKGGGYESWEIYHGRL